jgi:hypothetical protein
LGVPCVKRAWFLVWRIECLVLRTSIQNVNLLVLRVFVPNVMKFTNLSELSVRTEIQSLTVPRTRTMMMTVWNAKKIILNKMVDVYSTNLKSLIVNNKNLVRLLRVLLTATIWTLTNVRSVNGASESSRIWVRTLSVRT